MNSFASRPVSGACPLPGGRAGRRRSRQRSRGAGCDRHGNRRRATSVLVLRRCSIDYGEWRALAAHSLLDRSDTHATA